MGLISAAVGIVQFPGSNCDEDCRKAFKTLFDLEASFVWHTETSLAKKFDLLVIPGGFSYGDFLRSGALASHSPIMPAIRASVQSGRAVIGICNGFQILTEAQILPGALVQNLGARFVCKHQDLRVVDGKSKFHNLLKKYSKQKISLPIAHGEGRYFADSNTLQQLADEGRIAFTYENNPNGSVSDIAGITSADGKVLGLMPHPERAMHKLLGGSDDGFGVLKAFVESAL